MVIQVGKIEAQPDSIFMMRQSHDLVAFIHQEKRFIDMNNLHEKLSVFRGQLDDTSLDVPDVEAMLAQKVFSHFYFYKRNLIVSQSIIMFVFNQ